MVNYTVDVYEEQVFCYFQRNGMLRESHRVGLHCNTIMKYYWNKVQGQQGLIDPII